MIVMHNIPTRARPHLRALNRQHRLGRFLYEDAEWMRDAYMTKGLTLQQLATEAGCALSTIARWMEIHQIPKRSRGHHVRPRGEAAHNWKGDDAIRYPGVHRRVKKARGPASSYLCQQGCGNGATGWAYDHTDPAERFHPGGPYSSDVDRYIPMCTRCHKLFDLAFLRSK